MQCLTNSEEPFLIGWVHKRKWVSKESYTFTSCGTRRCVVDVMHGHAAVGEVLGDDGDVVREHGVSVVA